MIMITRSNHLQIYGKMKTLLFFSADRNPAQLS